MSERAEWMHVQSVDGALPGDLRVVGIYEYRVAEVDVTGSRLRMVATGGQLGADGRLWFAPVATGAPQVGDVAALSSQVERLRVLAGYDCAATPPRPADRCARCGGPVLLVTCAREGGCRTVEERIWEPVVSRVIGGNPYASEVTWLAEDEHQFAARARQPGCEPVCTSLHVDLLRCRSVVHGHHPTREGAIALWREQAIAADRKREGSCA